MNKVYKDQVILLLSVLPEVAKEQCFALHGGTAINLFVRDMPRISVDIDLTYLPIEDRKTSLENIAAALLRIKDRIQAMLPDVHIEHKQETGKLLISRVRTSIKLEVNLVGRGTLHDSEKRALCQKAQDEIDVFCSIPVVPTGQLYGGKICAALDRQHPRDLFDVKHLLYGEGFTEAIKEGFMLNLLSGARPIHETLYPNLIDQRQTMVNQFDGMTEEEFSYDAYEQIRDELIQTIHHSFTDADRAFLLSVKELNPDWSIYDFERFPAIQWKLLNLSKLRDDNPNKYQAQLTKLKEALNS